MGRLFPSVDYRGGWPTHTPEKRENARVGFHARHEAQEKLADYITEYTGKLTRQGSSISMFGELWKAFCAVKSGQWSKKTKENLQCLFRKHFVPAVGQQGVREITLTALQLLLNKMAEDGYRKSAIGQVRTYIKACFDYATDEEIIEKNPARELVMPNIKKKSCERFLTVDELRALLSEAAPREHLVLRILAVCGFFLFRPISLAKSQRGLRTTPIVAIHARSCFQTQEGRHSASGTI